MKIRTISRPKPTVAPPLPAPTPPASNRDAVPPPQVSPEELKQWLEKAKEMPDIRWNKVKAMREAIRSGNLDTDAKLANLADRLPSQLIDHL